MFLCYVLYVPDIGPMLGQAGGRFSLYVMICVYVICLLICYMYTELPSDVRQGSDNPVVSDVSLPNPSAIPSIQEILKYH